MTSSSDKGETEYVEMEPVKVMYLANTRGNSNTDKYDFCHMKSDLPLFCIFPRLNQIWYWNFYITHRSNFVFVNLSVFLNKAEVLYYASYRMWSWKLNHNKHSRHVRPNTGSETVQAHTCVVFEWHYTACGVPDVVVLSHKCCVSF